MPFTKAMFQSPYGAFCLQPDYDGDIGYIFPSVEFQSPYGAFCLQHP